MSAQFDTFAEFIAMGGHGLYVWLAYGSTVVVLLGNFFMLRRARSRQLKALRWSARAEQEVADQVAQRKKTEQEKDTVVRAAASDDSGPVDLGVDVEPKA